MAYPDDEPPPRAPRDSATAVACSMAVVVGLSLAVLAGGGDQIDGSAGPASAPAPVLAAKVPEPARPATPDPRRVYELDTNPLLDGKIRLGDVACDLPPLTREPLPLTAFHEAAVACLDEAWSPAISAAGAPFEPVTLDFSTDAVGGCGPAPVAEQATAYYCDVDQTIVMPHDRMLAHLGVDGTAHLALLAHEYGHHVQSMSGISGALADLEIGLATVEEEVEPTRRMELQANCFAGLFLAAAAGRGSLSGGQAEAAVGVFRSTTADARHGTHDSQIAWARAGFDGRSAVACNTWIAPADQVR